ncbi:MFS transporter [Streptomyces sp. NPDC004296]|uniref:MFS transporter n=1 Tax=Streptomyces sp. NPDC004296 TaxID=3364697 RepID=UPI0036AE325F
MQHSDTERMARQSETAGTHRSLTVGLCAGYFLVLLDVTVVNVALPRLGVELHAGSGLAWVVDAYTVPLAALLLAAGAVGDRLGHRRLVLIGLAGFGIASIVCALSPTIAVLIAGRALQGVAAALMLPGTLAMLSESAVTEQARARVIGLWAAVGGAALPAGPVVGGLLVQAVGWRAVFWLGVPVIIAALAAVLASAPRTARPADTVAHGSHERGVDWAGAALLAVSLGCVVTAIIQGHSSTVLGGVMVAVAVCAAFALWLVERRTPQPLLRVPSAARRPLAVACGIAAVMNLCCQGTLFVLTQVFQVVHELGPLAAGMVMLPAMVPMPLLGTVSGRLTSRFGPWRTSASGLLVAVAGFLGMALSLDGPNYPVLLGSLVVWGGGIGVLAPGIVTAGMRVVPGSPGAASGASNTSRQAGGAMGVALFGAVAGPPAGSSFAHQVGILMWVCATVFLLAAVVCFLPADSPGERQA